MKTKKFFFNIFIFFALIKVSVLEDKKNIKDKRITESSKSKMFITERNLEIKLFNNSPTNGTTNGTNPNTPTNGTNTTTPTNGTNPITPTNGTNTTTPTNGTNPITPTNGTNTTTPTNGTNAAIISVGKFKQENKKNATGKIYLKCSNYAIEHLKKYI